jgi:3-oxoadipate enol-lactonase
MPYANNHGTKIYWEESGAGEPLLLIMGLGGTHRGWRRILPQLAQKYRVIVFDNRGAGESDAPPAPFSITEMIHDAAVVLEAAEIEATNVLGISMGGMIAQEFTLNFPEKVRSLILANTFCGAREAVWAKPEVQAALQGRGARSPEEAFWAMAPYIYDASTPRVLIEEDLAARDGKFLRPECFIAQMQAIVSWSGTYSRLHQIKAPTLVLHGASDQLIPFENARIIAGAIPNARLAELENTSHIFMTDSPERSIIEILSFLEQQQST